MNGSIRCFIVFIYITTIYPRFCFSSNSDFYFIQITDTHWDNTDLEKTKDIVDNINKLSIPVKFVVHTGDIVSRNFKNQSVIDRGLDIMKKLNIPVYYVAGNHDISEKDFKQDRELFTKNFGKLSNLFSIEDVSIITLFNFEIKDSSGRLIFDPLGNLDSLMKIKDKNSTCLIFQHFPVADDFYQNTIHKTWSENYKSRFQSICESNNVSAVISGHFHRDEFHLIGNIPQFVSAPISETRGRHASYRIYHYSNGKISYFTQYL